MSSAARKAPPTPQASSAKQSPAESGSIYDGVFTDKDRKPLKIKVKKPSIKQSNPGNWKEEENKIKSKQLLHALLTAQMLTKL
jgi:SAGA-associated factor 73